MQRLAEKMTKEQCIEWAVMCASDVLPIFEAAFPGDRRPRKAIKAAQLYLLDPCEVTSKMAGEAARVATYAASAAWAASSAAHAAADAASNAASAAHAAPDRKAAYIEMGRKILCDK
jgi:hypothetical protein